MFKRQRFHQIYILVWNIIDRKIENCSFVFGPLLHGLLAPGQAELVEVAHKLVVEVRVLTAAHAAIDALQLLLLLLLLLFRVLVMTDCDWLRGGLVLLLQV